MKQRHEELEKVVKCNASNNNCAENKNSEHDSTANTNQEENEVKSEGKAAAKNEFDFILYLKNFINEVDSKNTEMNKKLEDFSCKNSLNKLNKARDTLKSLKELTYSTQISIRNSSFSEMKLKRNSKAKKENQDLKRKKISF